MAQDSPTDWRRGAVLALVCAAFACSDSESDVMNDAHADAGVDSSTGDAGTGSMADAGTGASGGGTALLDEWRINSSERSSTIFESGTTTGALYDVQLVEERTVDGAPYMYVETTGIPQYDVTMTQSQVDELNSRPRAASDFATGMTSVAAGDVVVFGQDIGYNSNTSDCTAESIGYWPPGPGCPVSLDRGEFFAVEPTTSSQACETGLGTIGLMVNGSAIFNWGDGMSYGPNIWYNLAPIAEQYDVDICGGHAANGEYHHHFYTRCLAALVGDDGTDHSPIYGFGADGYPMYGPYEGDATLALSGWVARDYGASTSEGGCGTPGERTCVLVDEYDISQGVDTSITPGPDVGETVSTLSGNSLAATSGYYYEDYYYAGAAVAGAQLDEHNGHDSGDGRGYHYHITLVEQDGKLTPAFPFTLGPRFRGELPDNAVTACGGGMGGGGMGPPGRPPGG